MESFPKSGIFLRFIHSTFCFFGVRWSTQLVRLQFLLVCCWHILYGVMWYLAIKNDPFIEECTLECVISYEMFLFMTLSHIIILVDTFLHRQRDYQLLLEAKSQLTPEIERRFNFYITGVFLFNITVRCIIIWSWIRVRMLFYFPFFCITTISSLGMQLRLMAFLFDILIANGRVTGLRQNLNLLARQKQPEALEVAQLKQRYGQLYKTFMQLNVKYGVSLVLIFTNLFFEFVYNAYLVLMNILIWSSDLQTMVHHLCFMSYMGLLLLLTCWHCQQSYNLSRQIGCRISKLVKPFGSKKYNDLVCEFSLQTLHQPFVVTAKNFFNLNLHLVSTMFAAVVTYLVILIQFKLAEKGVQMTRLEKN